MMSYAGDPAAILTDAGGDQGCRRTIMDGDPSMIVLPGVRQDNTLASRQERNETVNVAVPRVRV